MPSPVLNIDWLNQNVLRNYPIVDGASRVSSEGHTLPNGMIADISIPVPIGTVEPGNLFIKQIVGFSTGLAISFADRTAPGVTLASTTVFLADHQLYDSYTLVGAGALLGTIGRITLGEPLELLKASKLTYTFSPAPDNTRLAVVVTRPYIRGVTAIRVVDSSTAESFDLVDVVEIVQGDNMVLEVESGKLILNSSLLDPGDDTDDCGCTDPDDQEGTGRPIMTINNIEPDENGNFGVLGQDCTGIDAGTHALTIVDTCSEPCCDCDQLDVLYQGLQAVETESGRLQEVQEQLRGRLDNMQTVMLNSQLNPPGGAREATEGGTVWFLPSGPGGYGGVWVGG